MADELPSYASSARVAGRRPGSGAGRLRAADRRPLSAAQPQHRTILPRHGARAAGPSRSSISASTWTGWPAATATAVRAALRPGAGPVVLYTGVLDEFQRIDLLLEAMAEVGRHEPEAKLLIVVTIPQPKHLAASASPGRGAGGRRPRGADRPAAVGRGPRLPEAGDVAVVPRPQAPGFPIKLLNYMAAGQAVRAVRQLGQHRPGPWRQLPAGRAGHQRRPGGRDPGGAPRPGAAPAPGRERPPVRPRAPRPAA